MALLVFINMMAYGLDSYWTTRASRAIHKVKRTTPPYVVKTSGNGRKMLFSRINLSQDTKERQISLSCLSYSPFPLANEVRAFNFPSMSDVTKPKTEPSSPRKSMITLHEKKSTRSALQVGPKVFESTQKEMC